MILPKPVRDHLRLSPGAILQLEESAEGILLRPVKRRASLIEENGFLVHCGEAPPGFDWSRAVDDDREERAKDILHP